MVSFACTGVIWSFSNFFTLRYVSMFCICIQIVTNSCFTMSPYNSRQDHKGPGVASEPKRVAPMCISMECLVDDIGYPLYAGYARALAWVVLIMLWCFGGP